MPRGGGLGRWEQAEGEEAEQEEEGVGRGQCHVKLKCQVE